MTWLVENTGRRTVPQIFIGEESIGGFDDLRQLDDLRASWTKARGLETRDIAALTGPLRELTRP